MPSAVLNGNVLRYTVFFRAVCSRLSVPATIRGITLNSEHDSFQQRIYQILAAIPYGCVTTYGDVARLAGSPRAARQVGGVLRRLPEGSRLPWHRVINRMGEISLTGDDLGRQRRALEKEGIAVSPAGKVDLQRYRWCP